MLTGTWRATWKSHLVYHLEKSLGVRTVAGHGRIQVARQVAFDFHLASLQVTRQVAFDFHLALPQVVWEMSWRLLQVVSFSRTTTSLIVVIHF